MRYWKLPLIGMLCLAVPAQAAERYAVTPDGETAAHFAMPPAEASIDIANACRARGLSVIVHTRSAVNCRRDKWHDIADSLGVPTADTRDGSLILRFVIEGKKKKSTVSASGTRGVGFVLREDMKSDGFHDLAMDLMIGAGGSYPKGTSFPNHASMGFEGRIVSEQLNEHTIKGFKVLNIVPKTAAADSKLQPDDLVTNIGGHEITDYPSVRIALAKVMKDPNVVRQGWYEILIKRGAQIKRWRMPLQTRDPV